MNKKHRIISESFSKLDDDIVEKNTQRRYQLTKDMQKNRKKVKLLQGVRISSAVAALLLVCFGVVWIFNIFQKQVPIYTGMSISSAETVHAKDESIARSFLSNGKQEAGWHDNGVRGDHSGRNEQSQNGDKPFGEDAPAVEEAAESSLNVLGAAKEIYYAKPNEDIYITIHFENPDNFEILSFTLNGEKYASYMFEYGSDMENIILKKNVGAAEGVVEYTIDAIKYVDGTEIKDVRMEGDKTVRAGIATEKQPKAALSAEMIGFNDVSFDVRVSDPLSLVGLSGGKAYAVLYDGENVLDTKELTVGDSQTVKFENLSVNTLYQYAVVAAYDALDGNGAALYLLESKAFYTKTPVLFDAVTPTKTGVTFGYLWDEGFQTKKISSLTLSKDGTVLKELETTATEVTGLLSGDEYTLTATYQNGEQIEQIEITFTTLTKTVPTVSFGGTTKTQTSLGVEWSLTDPDAIGTVTKVELIHKDIVTEQAIQPSYLFENLLSNNDYTVKVTYTYDLNDGAGFITTSKQMKFQTDAYKTPYVDLSITNTTPTSISFEKSLTDPDGLGAYITKIELLDGNGTVVSDTPNGNVFEGLDSSKIYTVAVSFTYDLNDGNGVQIQQTKATVATVELIDAKCTFNQTQIQTGETVSLQLQFGEIEGLTVQTVEINGMTVSANQAGNKYYMSFIPNIESGIYRVNITKLTCVLNGKTVTVPMNCDTGVEIAVLGEITIQSVEFSNGENYLLRVTEP